VSKWGEYFYSLIYWTIYLIYYYSPTERYPSKGRRPEESFQMEMPQGQNVFGGQGYPGYRNWWSLRTSVQIQFYESKMSFSSCVTSLYFRVSLLNEFTSLYIFVLVEFFRPLRPPVPSVGIHIDCIKTLLSMISQ